jgi:hypothetical protein
MIADQTLSNMQPHLVNIAQHTGQVAAQYAGALATNLGKSALDAFGVGVTSAPSS